MVPTFSDWQISPTFPVFFSVFQYFLKFFFYLKYGTIFAGFSLLQADKFPWHFQHSFQFSSIIFSDFPVFWVKFPDFSNLHKIPWLFPDWKMPSHFSRFSLISSASGNYENIQILQKSPVCFIKANKKCWKWKTLAKNLMRMFSHNPCKFLLTFVLVFRVKTRHSFKHLQRKLNFQRVHVDWIKSKAKVFH